MRSSCKYLKVTEKFVWRILILRNQICRLWEILHMTLYSLQTASNNQFLRTQHCLLSSQFLKDTMAQFSRMVKQVQEKLTQCRVERVNSKVSFHGQFDTFSRQSKVLLIQRNILFVQHFYNFTMKSWSICSLIHRRANKRSNCKFIRDQGRVLKFMDWVNLW